MSTDTLDMFAIETKSSAIISECGAYRYRLERQWDGEKPNVAFLVLNPSTADASQDDPTIRRCIGFARYWGFGGLIVGNPLPSAPPPRRPCTTIPIRSGPTTISTFLRLQRAPVRSFARGGHTELFMTAVARSPNGSNSSTSSR